MIGIYKITNQVTNQSYIGSSTNIEQRFISHKQNIGSAKNALYMDMQKQGLQDFSFEIIEQCKVEQLKKRELYWIQHYNTFIDGYNLTSDGQGKIPYSYKIIMFKSFLEQNYLKIAEKSGLIIYLFPDNTFYLDLSLNIKNSIKSMLSKCKDESNKTTVVINFRKYCNTNGFDIYKTFFSKVKFLVYYIDNKEKRKEEYHKILESIQSLNLSQCCHNYKLKDKNEGINLIDCPMIPEPLCGIYELTFPNGKSYIGSSINLRRRVIQHLQDIRNQVQNWHCELIDDLSIFKYDELEKAIGTVIKLKIQYTINEEEARSYEQQVLLQIKKNKQEDKFYNMQYPKEDLL